MRAVCAWLVAARLCLAQADPAELKAHVEKAHEAQEQQDFKTAAQEWEAITKLLPNVGEAYSNLGMMYHFDQQYPHAIAAFEHAVKLSPNLLGPQLFLGIDYYLTSCSTAAIPHLEAALALAPNDPLVLKWMGMTYYELSDFKAALRKLARARQINPQDSDLLFYQSRAYTKLLFQSYETIRRLDAHSPFLEALRDKKVSVPAESPGVAAIESDFEANRLADAFEQSDQLSSRSPRNPAYWYWLGKSSEALALKTLDQFLRLAPDSYRTDQLKAEYALAIGDEDGAIKEFRVALSRRPEAPQLHESLGNIFMTRHQYERAVSEYEAEIHINPYALVSLERAGQAYAELHDSGRAMAYLDRALKIDPQSYEALHALGKVDFERGDYVNAAKHYRLAIQVNKDPEPAIFYQLSRTYKAMGDSAEAARFLARFREALATQHASVERSMNTSSDASASRQ